MIRVFIIEDHPWIIHGLKYEFRPSRDEIEIKGSAARISEVTDKVKPGDLDIFILDLWLSGSDPIDNVNELQKNFPDKPIVIFTHEESPFWKQKMFDAGVRGYLMKDVDKKELKTAIQQVARGEIVFPDLSYLKESLMGKSPEAAQKFILKPSEKEIFLLLSKGMNQKEVAEYQHKGRSAIEKLVRKIRKQFNVKSNAEVIHILTMLKEI